MAIIDLVRWAPQGDTTIYAWRFPETNLTTYTQLLVQESQEAILFSKGRIVGKFGPGKHTLNTENLPLLSSLYGIPFGGKNPFTAEVWYVNKTTPYNIDWQTSNMSIHDVDYNTQLPLVAKGRYGLRIADAEKFLVKIVGTKHQFDERDITDQFYGEICTKAKSAISKFMLQHHIGFKSISAYLDQLSEFLTEIMSAFMSNLGLELTQFYITGIDIDTSTENGRRVAEALSQQSSMSITGHTWQQEKMFDVANGAVDGMSNSNGGLIGGLMAMSMMGGFGGGSNSGMMAPQYTQPTFGGNQGYQENASMPRQESAKMVYCSNCSKRFPSTSQFCPYCGDQYNPCPRCGTDNAKNARRCVSCGTQLQMGNSACPNCGTPMPAGASFCGNCGAQVVAASDACSRCGAQLPAGVKFCPRCGCKR